MAGPRHPPSLDLCLPNPQRTLPGLRWSQRVQTVRLRAALRLLPAAGSATAAGALTAAGGGPGGCSREAIARPTPKHPDDDIYVTKLSAAFQARLSDGVKQNNLPPRFGGMSRFLQQKLPFVRRKLMLVLSTWDRYSSWLRFLLSLRAGFGNRTKRIPSSLPILHNSTSH